ncbi:MAG TPA: helix-turn-helix transcriptional regulator [Clostridia bacterium]|nr:helix-turn-helix transcriptional regulator [Clostridia bacterium]
MLKSFEVFTKHLRDLRKEKNLRQEDVAAELNTTRQTISKYERGDRQPDFHMLREIAEFYDVSIDYLFGRTQIRKVSVLDVMLLLDWYWPVKTVDRKD